MVAFVTDYSVFCKYDNLKSFVLWLKFFEVLFFMLLFVCCFTFCLINCIFIDKKILMQTQILRASLKLELMEDKVKKLFRFL